MENKTNNTNNTAETSTNKSRLAKLWRLIIVFVLVIAIATGIIVTVVVNNKDDGRRGEQITSGDHFVGDTTVSGDLNIRLLKLGFGDKWLKNIIADFEEAYPNVTVNKKDTEERQVMFGEIISAAPKYDLYFNEHILFDYMEDYLEPIDEVYSYKWQDEDKSVVEKMETNIADFWKLDGHYYSMPSYISWYGITYNADYIADEQIPNTTEELKALCTELKSNSITPIIFTGQDGVNYWNQMYCTWFAQYEGRKAFDAMQVGQIIDETGALKYDPSALYLLGAKESMQVCEDLLWYNNNYIDKMSVGYQYMHAQKKFLDGENCAMMVNGAWLMNEMTDLYPDGLSFDLRPMKTPIISSIINKCTTIADDAELSALVDAIDAGNTSLTGEGYDVSQADYDKVTEARNMNYIGGEVANACIPKAAKNKELAKLFLKFMYRDTSIKAHAASDSAAILPVTGYELDKELTGKDVFRKESIKILQNSSYLHLNFKDYMFQPYITKTGSNIEQQFGSASSTDRERAEKSYQNQISKYTANNSSAYYSVLDLNGIKIN